MTWIPIGCCPQQNGAKIERHVPALPLSRDIDRGVALRKTLTVYRMAFGQNRQDDIVEYLSRRFPSGEIESLERKLRIDLSPERMEHDGSIASAAIRPASDDSRVSERATSKAASINIHAAESLLNQFVKVRESQLRTGIEQYRDLLDRFVALRTGG